LILSHCLMMFWRKNLFL